MKPIVAAVAVALSLGALAVPSAASAKGSVPSRACGAERCIQLDGRPESMIFLDSDARRAAPSPAPYYRIEYSAPAVGPHYFVADGRLLAVETAGGRAIQWYALNGPGPNRLRAAIGGLEPYEAPDEWPTRIETPVAARGGGADVAAWLVGVLFAVVAAGAVVIRLARVRRLQTA